ncbi:UDP-glucose/GDP-mannose dehydrogenase family protein [Listeria grandensis]|uniref:UDP-glucose dehydrogenase family protein n=1 Tax=Listeria grandensis TaxID=1494963 RepID=UPI0016245F03|nr:UDP-glucose/GDP-mannose dehydrogenase family protein [Listeria grandensis]MBC1475361.1 UDP-glucose/GDP-mannose dehydrogenase family protein [Listeria grandensis]
MEKIVMAGVGYVGLVTGTSLAQTGKTVVCADISESKITQLKEGVSPIYEPGLEAMIQQNIDRGTLGFTTDMTRAYREADVIFICVGTPEQADGSASLTYIYEVAEDIANYAKKDTLIVMKSTVPVGTNQQVKAFINERRDAENALEIVSAPEFLSQGTAVNDTLHGARIVFGVETKQAEMRMRAVYSGFKQPVVVTDLVSAEMIKYASNDFLALKISFINDIANLCEKLGANIDGVTQGMGLDPRIGKQFLNAGVGYGGSCFPKDTKALYRLAEDVGYDLRTVKATIDVNQDQIYKLLHQAKQDFGSLVGRRVSVLGLTFKPGTDDLRESPAIWNIFELIKAGADVTVYDPVGMENARSIFQDRVAYADSALAAISDAEICFIFTEWPEIVSVAPSDFSEKMRSVHIYDGRNCFDVAEMAALEEVHYVSIGRPKVQRYQEELVGLSK